MDSAIKEKALEIRDQFRIFVGVSKDSDGELQNNYLVSKHVAKRSALLCVKYLIESSTSMHNTNYWLYVKAELEKL